MLGRTPGFPFLLLPSNALGPAIPAIHILSPPFHIKMASSSTHKNSDQTKRDLHWWEVLLANWSSLNIEPVNCRTHKIWTDTSGKKGIRGFYNSLLFATRVPPWYHAKHINWKEMYA